MKMRKEDGTCGCGSGVEPHWKHDGYGIPLCLVCHKCEKQEMKRYRPDIMTRYECDEPIEPDYYDESY